MPQMMPMYWMFIFIILTILMIIMTSNIYFFNINKLMTKKMKFLNKSKWNWLW